MANEDIKLIIKQMFQAWKLHEESWDHVACKHTREQMDCFLEVCGGDQQRAYMVHLFDYWGNDIQSMAPYFGISLERDDDTNIVSIKEDVPPAPEPHDDYTWEKGQWVKFEELMNEDRSTEVNNETI